MPDFKAFVRQQLEPLALPPERERKAIEEWAAQLEDVYEALVADGLSSEEAWRELQRQVPDWKALGAQLLEAEPLYHRIASPAGGVARGTAPQAFASAVREALATGLGRDLRASLTRLVRDRAFSLAAILTLAVCLGANAAVFTVVHSVLLRPLSVPDAHRIVAMGDVYPTITPNDILSNDAPSYLDRLAGVPALEEQALFTFWYDTIPIEGVAEEIRGMRATPSLFRVLRVAPALGRAFHEAEGELGAEQKVILSHELWQRLYGGDPTVIGRSLRLGWTGRQYTIVGVMPRGFSFFDRGYDGHSRTAGSNVQFWIPLALTPQQRSDAARTRYGFFHVGRLAGGATVEQVQAQIDALNAEKFKRFPEFSLAELGMYTAVTPLRDALTRDIRRTLYLLWGGAGFVLLIGTINIANLALARTRARARELATRLALGARPFQLRRQLIVEGLLPAALGGAAGLGVAWAILRALASSGLANLPGAQHIGMDSTVIAAIAGLSLLVGVLIGVMPATRSLPAHGLVEGGRSGTGGRASRMFGRGLIVTQVGLSLVLLIGATLLLASFRNLLRVDAGFSADRVLTATIFPPPSRYPDARAVDALVTRVVEAVRGVPGVHGAGMTTNIALSGAASPATVSATPDNPRPGEPAVIPTVVGVTPGYFEVMGTPLVRGRYFADTDRSNTLPVAIVDERLAARLWPAEDPIGKRMNRGSSEPYTVVGIVRNVRFEGLTAQTDGVGAAYFPHAQAPPLGRLRWIAVKSAADPAALVRAVRSALSGIDPDLPLSDVQTMRERTSRALTAPGLATRLASLFAVVALFLSVLGIYAVLTYVVAGRTREIGIRMALGSTVGGIFRLVLWEGLTFIAAGLLLGLAGAVAMGRVLQSQLFGVQPGDPLILGAVAALAGVAALLACIAPALRASHVDPIIVLAEQ